MNYIVFIYVVAIFLNYPIKLINHIWIIYDGGSTQIFWVFVWGFFIPMGTVEWAWRIGPAY